MKQIKPLAYDVAPLIEAVKEFDRTKPERDKRWDSVESNEDVFAAEKADMEALERVQEAFWQVTQDRNSRESCKRINIDDARRTIACFNERS